MKCTQCKQNTLEPVELEIGLIASKCFNCEGVLLPLMNYRYWADNQAKTKPAPSGHITTEPTTTDLAKTTDIKDSSNAKTCPKCAKFMLKFRLGLESENRLDMCNHCDEAWLDKDEWSLIKTLNLHNVLPKVFTDAWQKNIRKQKEANSLKAHFSLLIGEKDFEKIESFKSWLDEHPKKSDIKHFINTNFD